jgi:hypothetical protein
MVKHINIVGTLLMAWGAFQLLIALALGLLFFLLGGGVAVLGGAAGEGELVFAGGIYVMLGIFVGVVSGVMSLPGIVAGYGVTKRKSWARVVAMIVAAMSMMSFPLGTLLGVYTFVTLLDRDVADEFEAAR